MAAPNKQPKGMSSRLLTMKFMQRASGSPASAPSTPGQPPSKKQRLSSGSYKASPTTPRSDAQVMQEAIASEEKKRSDAVNREAADRGDTKWYLSFQKSQSATIDSPLRIVSAGFSALDAADGVKEVVSDEEDDDDDDEEVASSRPPMPGRRSFGRFNRAVEKRQNPDVSSSDSESEEEEGGEEEDEDLSDDPTGAKALIAQTRKEAAEKARQERSAKRKAAKAESLRLAEERRKKQVKLNGLTSISGSGGTPPGKGHMQRDRSQSARKGGQKKR